MNKIVVHIKSEWYKYVLEIIVVVIGIMVAFSLNNWKQSVELKKIERQIYSDFLQELRTDLVEIQGNRRYNQKYLSRFQYASEIILNDTQMQLADTLGLIALELSQFSDFDKNESAYEVLAASGKLALITNKNILGQMQQLGIQYSYINRLEKIMSS